MARSKEFDIAFEESLREHVESDIDVIEVPLSDWATRGVAIFILAIGIIVMSRVFVLAADKEEGYASRARLNMVDLESIEAPRGLIYDRFGEILAENVPSFFLFLDVREFLSNEESKRDIIETLSRITGMDSASVWSIVQSSNLESAPRRILLSTAITNEEAIRLEAVNTPGLIVESNFQRVYPKGESTGSVLGYTGLAGADDLADDRNLSYQSIIGRAGIEAIYNDMLRGQLGRVTEFKNAVGETFDASRVELPKVGDSLSLAIDADLQEYFSHRLSEGLRAIGRSVGTGIAIDPRNGEVLALVNMPGFDGNIFLDSKRSEDRTALLESPLKPLFNRAISGLYSPGSTIKPLVGVAALHEGVIDASRKIFSPGYLDIPNPYQPDSPTRFLDWRPQGHVDMRHAIAQSSNVYFYTVGGGSGDIKGLGISRLKDWWNKFRLGEKTGIDLPGEAQGVLPDPLLRKEEGGGEWRLGDTYNVSIGQGDLRVTPIALLNYIAAIANGGTLYRPHLNKNMPPEVIAHLPFQKEIQIVREGMREGVVFELGTAHSLQTLPFSSAAKTGSAQIKNNTQVNAFFVGFAPYEDPRIAILVLVENADGGSVSALPIAKDVLDWYGLYRF